MGSNARSVKGQVLIEALFCTGVFFACIYFAMYNMCEANSKRRFYDRIGHWSSHEEKNKCGRIADWFESLRKN